MKLSNRKIVEGLRGLKELSEKQIPVNISFKIAKNTSKVEAILKIFNREKEKLIDKYAEKDSKGNVITDKTGYVQIKKDCIEKWNKDYSILLDIENDIDIQKFKIDKLNGFSISPAELTAIDYMIEE